MDSGSVGCERAPKFLLVVDKVRSKHTFMVLNPLPPPTNTSPSGHVLECIATYRWTRRKCAAIRKSWTDTPATFCPLRCRPAWLCGTAAWFPDSWRSWTLWKTPKTCRRWSAPNQDTSLHRNRPRRSPCNSTWSNVPC